MKAYIRIRFKRPVNPDAINLGALEVTNANGNGYLLDVTSSWEDNDEYTLWACATEDFESFPKESYRYDLSLAATDADELSATLFVETEDDNEVKSITYDLTDNTSRLLATDLTAAAKVTLNP